MLKFQKHNLMIALATLAKLARTQEGVLVKAMVKAMVKVMVKAMVKAMVKVLVKVKFRSTVASSFSKYLKLKTGTPYHDTESLIDFSRLPNSHQHDQKRSYPAHFRSNFR